MVTQTLLTSLSQLTLGPEIVEDVKEECEKYGAVLDVKIPRPSMGSRQSAGVGKIFIKYDSVESARKALASLAGRKFADRTVVTTYFSEVSTINSTFGLPSLMTHRKTLRSMHGRRVKFVEHPEGSRMVFVFVSSSLLPSGQSFLGTFFTPSSHYFMVRTVY